ncbi:MAG: hypothetical protein OEV21_05585 [Thermoplasmata archaeon]|nr:hypothetical protein [Thermoplasmata archaeon]
MISDTGAALEKEDFVTAIKLAEQSDDASQKALHEHYATVYSRAQQIILKIKDLGASVDHLQKDLKDTKAMIETQDYRTAITSVRTVLESATDMLKSRVINDIDSIEDGVLAAEDMGADVSKLKEYVTKARELLDSKDFDEAMSYARRAQNETDKSVSGKIYDEIRKIKEDVRVVRKHGGDVDQVNTLLESANKAMREKDIAIATQYFDKAQHSLKETQFKLVLQAISKSKDNFVLAKKLKLDISGPIVQLNGAREKLQKGLFEEAMDSAEQAEKDIDNILSSFRNAQDGIEKLAAMIKEVEESGIEIPPEISDFEQAKKALTMRDFAQANEKAKDGAESIQKFLKKTSADKIAYADDLIAVTEQLGIDNAQAKSSLKEAREELTNQNPIESIKKAHESVTLSNSSCREILSDTISALEAFLDECSKSFDVKEYKDGLVEARQLVEYSQFVDALSKIADVKEGFEKRGAEECKRLIGDAEIKINELEAAGADASDLRLMISKADEAYQKGQYENAVATAKEAVEDAEEELEKSAHQALFTLKKVLDDAKSDSVDTTKWRAFFKQSKELLDSGESYSSYQISQRVLTEITQFTKDRQSTVSRINRCQELLAEAAKNKIDVSNPSALIEKAKAALSSLDIEMAKSHLDEAEKSVESSMGMYLSAKLIIALKSSVEFAERESLSIGEAKELLDDAKASMKVRQYQAALESAKKARAIIDTSFGSKVDEEISLLKSLIADAKNVGVDVTRPEKLLGEAQDNLDGGDYENSLKSVLLARNEIDQIRDLSSKSAIELRIAKERIRDAEAIGIDMSSPRETLDQAVDSLNSHKYAIAFELARKVAVQALEHMKENLQDLLDNLEKRIDKVESEGLAIGDSKAILEEARNFFNSSGFPEAIKQIMSCENELDRADLQFRIAQGSLEVARKRIADAEKDMLIVTRAKKVFEEAETAMKDKEFPKVIELSISIGDEIGRADKEAEGCHLDMSSLIDRLSRLSRIGLEIPALDELRAKAEEYLQNAEFEKCREICIDGERMISVELENIIKEGLSMAEMLIDLSAALGITDDKEFRSILEVAQTSANEGLWDFAYEQMRKCVTTIEAELKERLFASISDVRSRLSIIAKTGASIKAIEEDLKDAEKMMDEMKFQEAFKVVLDAGASLSSIESLHKEYLDAKYAAESTTSLAKKFGIPTRDADRMIAKAETERESDYSSAIDILRQAVEITKTSLDKFNPDIEITIQPVELKHDQKANISIDLTNKGKALAKDLKIEFSGANLEVESMPELTPIRAGDTKKISIPIIPKQPGDSEISISIGAKRVFDGRDFEFVAKNPIVILPKEASARIARATEIGKCSSCSGKIKPGFDIAICNKCQNMEHLACAKRSHRCGVCGAALDF